MKPNQPFDLSVVSLPVNHRGAARHHAQRGGTAVGVVLGLLVGLALALIVALYVTKVPVPFVNKVPQRSAEQEAAEAERHRNWDPNGKLGATAPRSATPATGGAANAPATSATSAGVAPYVPPVPPAPSATSGTPARSTAPTTAATTTNVNSPPAAAPATKATATTATAAPATAAAPSAVPAVKTGPDPYVYFVQAGAYTRQEDAEQQRARLAMLGHQAKVTEREQVGRTMYRVRMGPYETKDIANGVQGKLQQASIDAALVAVERSPR